MKISCTKKVIDYAKLTTDIKDTKHDIYAWHVNYQMINNKPFFIFMNDLTTFSVCIYGLKKQDFKDLGFDLYHAIRHQFIMVGYPVDLIEKYIKDIDEVTFLKTESRKTVARLNRIMDDGLAILDNIGIDTDNTEQNLLAYKLNQMIISEDKENYFTPIEKMHDYLNLL
jgi:hypothetical protein